MNLCAWHLLAGTILSTALVAPARAQNATAQPPVTAVPGPPPPSAPIAAPDAPRAAVSNGGLEEIVVTAQRREQKLQSVPIAITALTAAYAAQVGITSTLDIQTVAPSVNWGSTVGGANISIRGIQGTGSAGDESANAVYVDGVYNPVGGSLIFGLNNVARVEILKGPQGTLFGRNASGGAIQIITKDPSHKPALDFSVGYGSFETVEGNAYATAGLTDTLAADIAVYGMHMGKGWGTNVFNGHDAYKGSLYSLRTKWLWQPTTGTDVTGTYSHNENSPPTQGGTQVLQGEGAPYNGFYNTDTEIDQFNKTIQNNASLKVKHELPGVTLVNIASFDKSVQYFNLDGDGRPAVISRVGVSNSYTDSKTFTEEFQLLSPRSSKISWVGGLYYYYNRMRRDPVYFQGAAFPGGQRVIYSSMPTNSYSAYGQVTVPLTDTLNLTGGLRYTKDDRSISGYRLQGIPALPAPYVIGGVVFPTINQKARNAKLTWHGSLDYHLSPEAMVYVSATRGFKSGFFNITSPEQLPVNPQVVDAYEAGFKTTLFDNHVRLNGSAFVNKFSNIQLRTSGPLGPQFFNAANATIKGFDLDLSARPLPNLMIQAGASYLHGKYGDFIGPIISFDSQGVPRESFTLLSGKTTIRTPTFTGSLGGVYTIPSEAGKFELSANIYHNSGFLFDPQNRVHQPAYDVVNASISWASPNKAIEVRLWGKNLTKSQYYTEFNIGSVVGDLYWPAAPRTYGVTFTGHI